MSKFDGKVALVTGAASGIGRASALAFARQGAKVVVADVDIAGGEKSVELIGQSGGDALFFRADVTVGDQVSALVRKTVEHYGRLDCAHNNAGMLGAPAALAECSEEAWDRIVNLNLRSVWLCMKHEIPAMIERGGGAIVNTASVAGLVGVRGLSPYTATKHAVVGLSKTAALDYVKRGIRVNAICPGLVRTPMVENYMQKNPAVEEQLLMFQPLGRMAAPEEVAAAVVWLCSDEASFVTGTAMTMDGAWTAQ
jgi:NAD(P)-dependent dehydrogenase (short-subunit alcohol dehydrogenase family)